MQFNLLRRSIFGIIFCLLFAVNSFASENQEHLNSLYDNASSLGENLKDYTNQETEKMADQAASSLSPKNIFQNAYENFLSSIKVFWKYFMYILGIILISAIFSGISDGFVNESIFEFVSILLLVSVTLIPISNCVNYVVQCTSRLCDFMTSFIPSMTVIYTAGGSTSTAASSAIICSSAITVLQLIGTRFVIPGAKICVCLTAISSLCKNVNLSGVSSFIKSTCMWISGLVMTLFCGILSVQTSLQTGTDTLALKGVKYSAARFIPVAGGMVSESLKTVLSGVAFVRGVSGALGIAFIIYCIIPPLASIVVFKFICSVSAVMAKLSGCGVQSAYLEGLNSALTLLLSIVLCCAVAFIIMLAIFMKTTVNV